MEVMYFFFDKERQDSSGIRIDDNGWFFIIIEF